MNSPAWAYRGRLAPSPTGYLHLGHARTFWVAFKRAKERDGTLVLRNEDLDRARCKLEFASALIEDLKWLGIHWQEGPDCGGPWGPYSQSDRLVLYRNAFQALQAGNWVYPCTCSRKDVQQASQAPHPGDDEPLYPGTCRPAHAGRHAPAPSRSTASGRFQSKVQSPISKICWRFGVPDGEEIAFNDGSLGPQAFVAGNDFGDFIVWTSDDCPSYQLAVVVDDSAMQMTEVVRGADLLKSTARQLLLYRALGLKPPDFFHVPLVVDSNGVRLAKRHDALSLRKFRAAGATPEQVLAFTTSPMGPALPPHEFRT